MHGLHRSRFTLIDSETYTDYDISSNTFYSNDFMYSNDIYQKHSKKLPYPMTINIENVFSTSSQNFFNCRETLSQSPNYEAPFPIAVRYIQANNTFYVERPPFQVDVNMYLSRTRNTTKAKTFGDFKIWIPWTILAINPNYVPNVSFFFSHKSLSSMDDIYFPSFLPNTFSSGNLCLGAYVTEFVQENNLIDNNNLRYVYSSILNEYLNGGWNLDISPNLDPYARSYIDYINLGKITPETYPTLNKFFYPTEEQFSKLTFKVRKNVLTKYIESRYLFNSYAYSYKYLFTLLSTFTLEETISFYKELSEFNLYVNKTSSNSYRTSAAYVRTFQSIVDNSSSSQLSPDNKNHRSTFFTTYSTISSSVSSALYKNISDFIPYSSNLFSSNIIFHITDSFNIHNTQYHNAPVHSPHYEIPSSAIHPLVNKLLYIEQNNLYDFSKTIIFYNIDTQVMTFESLSEDQTFSEYYLQYLDNNYLVSSQESIS